MNYKKMFCTLLLSAVLSLQVSAYTVTHVAEAPQWQIDWSYNQPRPDWQEPSPSAYINFSVILVTLEEELQPYASNNDLLALFVGDELRGMSGPALDMSTGETDNKHFLVKAYGDESGGDMIDVTLKYYNAQLRQVFSRSTTMAYNPDEVLGIEEDFIPNFTLGSAKYPVVKTIDVADILASAGITPAEGDIAAAFVGDECRGVSPLPSAAVPDGSPSGITLFLREADETVILKYYDAARNRIITFDGSVTGDANGDGTVDVADIATVISVMASDGTLGSVPHYADVNGDGTVDVADIATIISIMAGAPTSPSEQVSNTRPLTISVTEKPFINPDASASSGTASVKRAAITTTSTLLEFRMDYTYGTDPSHDYRTATKDGEGKWKHDGEGWPDVNYDVTVNWYAHNGDINALTGQGFHLTDDADKKPYLSFTVNDDVTDQKDLLVATTTGSFTATGGNLSLIFDHACSALRFYMKKAKNISDYTLTVTNVTLHNVVKTGDYYFNTSFNTASWLPGTDKADYTIFSGSATLGDTDYTTMDTSDTPYLIVIPQTLTPWNGSGSPANTYLKLSCTISKEGYEGFTGTAYIPFGATLEKGTQYDVKINIGKNSLYKNDGTKIIN